MKKSKKTQQNKPLKNPYADLRQRDEARTYLVKTKQTHKENFQ